MHLIIRGKQSAPDSDSQNPSVIGSIIAIHGTNIMLEITHKQKLSPEKAVEILRRHGTYVTMEEAEIILDFLHKLSILTVEIILKDEDRRLIHQG